MKVGTRSLLFGVHQFAWHPFTVWLAWIHLYREFPTWRECVCIIIHDWGYWGCREMDGEQGRKHPFVGSRIASWLFDKKHGDLVLWHSRHLAKRFGFNPSKLCWADKFSMFYDPSWFYLLRACSSGEIHEYRANAWPVIPVTAPHRRWLSWLKEELGSMAKKHARCHQK